LAYGLLNISNLIDLSKWLCLIFMAHNPAIHLYSVQLQPVMHSHG